MQSATPQHPGGRPWDSITLLEAGAPAAGRGLLFRLRSRLMRLAPRPLVRMMARPYIAGETRAEAVALVRQLQTSSGLSSTIDVLGEDIRDAAEAGIMLREYMAILDDLGSSPYANISVKLSALGQALDEDLCARNLETLLARAAASGQFVRFDMEDHTTTDSTLRLFRRMVGRFPRIGVVLQSRLHRTGDDIRALAPLRPNVRLCLGIYREPAAIALQDKPAMKERLLELLRMMWENGQYVGIATHDEPVIRRALELAAAMKRTPEQYEFQMLLGVPRAAIQNEILSRGIRMRLYVPYGEQWYHYCLRRLDNNPDMARMVFQNLMRKAAGR